MRGAIGTGVIDRPRANGGAAGVVVVSALASTRDCTGAESVHEASWSPQQHAEIRAALSQACCLALQYGWSPCANTAPPLNTTIAVARLRAADFRRRGVIDSLSSRFRANQESLKTWGFAPMKASSAAATRKIPGRCRKFRSRASETGGNPSARARGSSGFPRRSFRPIRAASISAPWSVRAPTPDESSSAATGKAASMSPDQPSINSRAPRTRTASTSSSGSSSATAAPASSIPSAPCSPVPSTSAKRSWWPRSLVRGPRRARRTPGARVRALVAAQDPVAERRDVRIAVFEQHLVADRFGPRARPCRFGRTYDAAAFVDRDAGRHVENLKCGAHRVLRVHECRERRVGRGRRADCHVRVK